MMRLSGRVKKPCADVLRRSIFKTRGENYGARAQGRGIRGSGSVYIPEGYGTVFPYMIVDDANSFVDFLKNIFAANEVGRTEFPDGRVANVQVRIGTSEFVVDLKKTGRSAVSQ